MGSLFLVHVPPTHNNQDIKPNKNPINSLLVSKAQSTICICLVLLVLSLLLFTLSTFDPTTTPTLMLHHHHHHRRRELTFINLPQRPLTLALQGMGTLYARGTRSMHVLLICHLTESVNVNDVSLFLRLFFRSSLYSYSDILFLFNSTSATFFDSVIRLEHEFFLDLLTRFQQLSDIDNSGFGGAHFVKESVSEEEEVIIWGKRFGNVSELTRSSYGSVIGFEVDELDSENSLSGFMDQVEVPMSLRRWACYTMLLGRVRRSFKHVMLVDLKQVLLLGDPLGRVTNKTHHPESIYLSTFQNPGRKNSDITELSPSIIFGGGRGIRRLSKAMIIEIVRAAMQRKSKNSVSESGVLSQLVKNEYFLKNVKLMVSTELTPEVSVLNSAGWLALSNYSVLRRGNNNNNNNNIEAVYGKLMKHFCSFPLDSLVYSDC